VSGLRDRLGSFLRHRWVAALEAMVVPLMLWLQAGGIVAKPKLPLLFFGWLSMWLRRVSWREVGLRKPAGWPLTILTAILVGIAYNALDVGVILPSLHRLTGEPLDLSELEALKGNASVALLLLAASWLSAAFPEELLYRGYLLNRLSDFFGRHTAGWAVSAALVSVAFGFAHHAQGITGILDNVIAGLLFAGLYFASRGNLWLPILTHGIIDTTSVALLYYGFRPPAP
jgi:membrane protease YdiL (CAAX protease family)